MAATLLVCYDGECATCQAAVRFLLRRRRRDRFRFVPLGALFDRMGAGLTDRAGRPVDGDSLVVIRNGLVLQRTAAVIAILGVLEWPWRALTALWLVPRPVRDLCYDLYARNRYRITGKVSPDALCDLPDPAVRPLLLTEFPDDVAVRS